MKTLLRDVRALEYMLENDMFETGVRRIGAEQEIFLVDANYRPANKALEILARLPSEHFTTELAQFNLECNLDPHEFGDDCLSQMESQLDRLLAQVRTAAHECDAEIVMTGILPTLTSADLGLDSMTPMPRYFALNDAMTGLRGGDYEFRIEGADEFILKHDSVMVEACNTSFQVHFQVGPSEFARLYNMAQAIAGPTLAAAANSPLLLGKRLWCETRIALFQQSVDTRQSKRHLREVQPRVSFGSRWVDDSVLEIFREDIARFRVLLGNPAEEDPFVEMEAGRVPNLTALRLHNGTVYRWNRPCYGISNGRPHLRIENRVLPAGPTVVDEIANAAYWFGLMSGAVEEYGDINRVMSFDVAKGNFVNGARQGLGASLTWVDGKSYPVAELSLEVFLPLARSGLARRGISSDDIDRYMGIMEERVRTRQTGARWMLMSFEALGNSRSQSEKLSAITAATVSRQQEGSPVHSWPLAAASEGASFRENYYRVGQYMQTDIFTVNENELVDMVASIMDWQKIRHVPVEDEEHRLVGIVTNRTLLRLVGRRSDESLAQMVPVSSIMQTEVVTVPPETPTLEAIRMMRELHVACLPVVKDGRLIGMVTETDMMEIARELLEEKFASESSTTLPAIGNRAL
jgi:CBS domain-containing protein/gamma-glutamylcysteine synthetase